MSDQIAVLRETLAIVSMTGRSLLRQLTSIDNHQIEQAIDRVPRPHAAAELLMILTGEESAKRLKPRKSHLVAKNPNTSNVSQVAIEIARFLAVIDYLLERRIYEIDAVETVQWLAATRDLKRFFAQCNDLIIKLTDLPNEARREIEQNSGDSWINQFNMDPASGRARAILVSSAQLGEYVNNSDDIDNKLSVAIYLDTDDEAVQQTVVQRIREFVEVLGYEESGDAIVEHGSIFRKSWARLKKGLTSTEVRQRLVKAERALEIGLIEERQANTDSIEAQAVGQLLSSLELVSQACVRVGSILLIKYQGSQGTIVLVRNLSQLEIRALERFPEIQQNPQKVLQSLSLAIAAQHDDFPAPNLDLES